jgi:hypothetical protein
MRFRAPLQRKQHSNRATEQPEQQNVEQQATEQQSGATEQQSNRT